MAKIKRGEKMKFTLQPKRGAVKAWMKDCSNADKAAYATLYYAKKANEDMLFFAGNSFGNFVWHINYPSKVSKTEMNNRKLTGYIVTPNGECYKAVLGE